MSLCVDSSTRAGVSVVHPLHPQVLKPVQALRAEELIRTIHAHLKECLHSLAFEAVTCCSARLLSSRAREAASLKCRLAAEPMSRLIAFGIATGGAGAYTWGAYGLD